MIDAYTIGINLALDGGISEGIAAIQNELATLDRAAENSAAGLERLKQIAGELSAGPKVRPAPTSTPSKVPVIAAAESQDEVPPGGEAVAPSRSIPDLEPVQRSGIPEPQPNVVSAPKAEAPAKADPTAPIWQAPSRSVVSEVTVRVPPLVRQSGVEKEPAALPARAAKQEPGSYSPPTARADSGKQQNVDGAGTVFPAREPLSAQSERFTPASAPEPRRSSERTAVALVAPVPPAMLEPTPPSEPKPAAPVTKISQEPKTYAPVQPAKTETAASAKLVRKQADRRPEEALAGGIITLDGMALGRWVADYLTRKTDRPSAGFTGFDGRMNAAPIATTINS